MVRRILFFLLFVTSGLWAQLPTVVRVQEALPCTATTLPAPACGANSYVTGVARTSYPSETGIPIADADAIRCGATACPIHSSVPNTTIGLRVQDSSGNQLPSQFYVTEEWPSGNVKAIKLNLLSSLPANGADATAILCKTGTTTSGVVCGASTGNSSGAALATDNGATISVSTGVGTFTINKKNFDGVHNCVVNGVTVCQPDQGFVIMGPAVGQTTCPCTTPYTTAADNNSNAAIEENGPLKTVIVSDGAYVNGTQVYLRQRTRLTFYANSADVLIDTRLRNADEGASNSFQSAWKYYASWNYKLAPQAGANAWAFGTDTTTPATGSFVSTESAVLYQAYSNSMESNANWNSLPNCPAESCVISPITRTSNGNNNAPPWTYAQDGYTIVYNGTPLAGYPLDHTHYPSGWADVSNSTTGAGVEVNVRYFSGKWPKSLQLTASEVIIGLHPDQSLWPGGGGIPYQLQWPTYRKEVFWLSFHSAAQTYNGSTTNAQTNVANAHQYNLIARAMGASGADPVTYYNNAKGCSDNSSPCTLLVPALHYPLVKSSEQDSYWINIQNTESLCNYSGTPAVIAPCNPLPAGKPWTGNGIGCGGTPAPSGCAGAHDIAPAILKMYPWRAPGSGNQHEKNAGLLDNRWLERGHTGAYLYAFENYNMELEDAFPHSDVALPSDTACPTKFGNDLAGNPIFHFRCATQTYLGTLGFPTGVTSLNNTFAAGVGHAWVVGSPLQDFEHAHWWGLLDEYTLTGDNFIYDFVQQGPMDIYANTQPTEQQGNYGLDVSRAIGNFLEGAARTFRFAKDVGDPTGETGTILTMLQNYMGHRIFTTDFCPSTAQGSWPALPGSCYLNPAPAAGGDTAGISRTRGVSGHFVNGNGDNNGGGDIDCPTLGGVGSQPCGKPWMMSIMEEGMLAVYQDVGAGNLATINISANQLLDLMYGAANWSDREAFILGPTGTYTDTKLSYDVLMNGPNPMSAASGTVAQYEFNYYVLGLYQGYLTTSQQERFVQNYLNWSASGPGMNADNVDDQDMYISSNVINTVLHPASQQLSALDQPTSTNCSGTTSISCTINWVNPIPPTGLTIVGYKLKQFPNRKPTEWIGFEPTTFTYTATARQCTDPVTGINSCSGDPVGTEAWFAGQDVTGVTIAPGATSATINNLPAGTTWNFGIKAIFGPATVTGTPCPSSSQPENSLNQAPVGCLVNLATPNGLPDNWTLVWPTNTNKTNPNSAGWHRSWFNPTLGSMETYQEESGNVTFSYVIWSLLWQTQVQGQPWNKETDCQDPSGNYSTTSSAAPLLTQLNPTDTQFTIQCSNATNCSPNPSSRTAFFCSNAPGAPSATDSLCQQRLNPSMLSLRIDDEVLSYTDYENNFPVAGQGTFFGLTRATRGSCSNGSNTTCMTHPVSTNFNIFQACPAPIGYSRFQGKNTLINLTDGMEPRHPFRDTTYSRKNDQVIQVDAQAENSFFKYTWFYHHNSSGAADPFWEVLPLSTSLNNTILGTNKRTDGAADYDDNDDVLIQYGGGNGPSTTLIVLCRNASTAGSIAGCNTLPAGQQINVWVTIKPLVYGTRWDGVTCTGTQCGTATAAPDPRQFLALTWNSSIKRFVIFGGTVAAANCTGPVSATTNPWVWNSTSCPSESNEVWLYNPYNGAFQQAVNTVGSQVPAPTRRPAIAYDSSNGTMVLWEGPNKTFTDGSGAAWVGYYEANTYRATFSNVGATGTANVTWAVQDGIGCNSTPCASGPPAPYSQTSSDANNRGFPCTIVASGYICDHATENLVYDDVHNVFIFEDIDTSCGPHSTCQNTLGDFTTWIVPNSTVRTSGVTPPSGNNFLGSISTVVNYTDACQALRTAVAQSGITASHCISTPAPTINSVTPNAGATGTAVTISGANFRGPVKVFFGSTAATSVITVNSTTITAVAPSGAGTVTVSVTNVDGTTGFLGNAYTYQ